MKMRRITALFLVMAIMLSIAAPYVYAVEPVEYGDANGDGEVDLRDVLLLERYAAGESVSINFANSDVNSDGAVDALDVGLIRDYLVDNLTDFQSNLCVVSFDTDGAQEIPPVTVGKGASVEGEIPSPNKDGFLFTGWVKPNGDTFYQEDPVAESMLLTATYAPLELAEQLSVTSFTPEEELDVDAVFEVRGDYSSAAEVKANLDIIPKDGSDTVETVIVDSGDGIFTVGSANGFTAGATYELNLGDGLFFVDMDEMYRTCVFIIAKAEQDDVHYNQNLVFIKDTADMKYTVDGGEEVDMLELSLISNEGESTEIFGTFTMNGNPNNLTEGSYLCIYENVDPRLRDYTESNFEDDRIAYVKITAVNGNVFSFRNLSEGDADKVLQMPDTIPFKVAALPEDGDDNTVDRNGYDGGGRVALGFTDAPKFNIGDYLIFYTAEFAELTEDSPHAYGQVTGTDGHTVHYKTVGKDYIESHMGLFVKQEVDGDEVLDSIDQEEFLEQVEQQAYDSGFAEEAVKSMVQSSLETGALRESLAENGFSEREISELRVSGVTDDMLSGAGAGGNRVTAKVEKTKCSPKLGKSDKFKDGVMLKLEVLCVLSISMNVGDSDTSSLKIELCAGFQQDLSVDVSADIDDEWDFILGFIPKLEEVKATVDVDIKSYSHVYLSANIYTVAGSQKKTWEDISAASDNPAVQDALKQINTLGAEAQKFKNENEEQYNKVLKQIEDAKKKLPNINIGGQSVPYEEAQKQLGMVNISEEFEELMEADTDDECKVGIEKLVDKYTEMLNRETDWVKLFEQEIAKVTINIKIVQIRLTLTFIVQANVNISIGADLEYTVGKRYSFWVKIIARQSGSSEVDLLDERFAFQFYVMGTIGLKVGIKAAIDVGLLSVDLASIGVSVEFGPYIKIYGYFFYIFIRERKANTQVWNESKTMIGALYIEFGLYLTVRFKAQILGEMWCYEPTLYDGEFPLLWAGERKNAYTFARSPKKGEQLLIVDDDNNSTNGINMVVPDSYRQMKELDLKTGAKTEGVYGTDRFAYTSSSGNFTVSPNGIISAVPPAGVRYMTGEINVIWKCGKLSFSYYDTKITVPVVWTNYSEEELNEKFHASVAVGNETDGYEIVWSQEYGRLDTVNLPTKNEVLEIIGFDQYKNETTGENMKYDTTVSGYKDGITTTGFKLTSDMVYYFDVKQREYTLTVDNVQKADGSTETRTFKTTYGEIFDTNVLKQSGAHNLEDNLFTTFFHLRLKGGTEDDVFDSANTVVNSGFYDKFGLNANLEAVYADDTRTATFTFAGIAAPEVTVKFRKGETPYFEGLNAYVQQHSGAEEVVEITDIQPPLGKSESSMTYLVTVTIAENPAPEYTLTFDSDGGNAVAAQLYREGSQIYQPTNPVKSGYAFDGWFIEDPEADDGWRIIDFDTEKMAGHDLTFTAKWTARPFIATFRSQEEKFDPIELTYGQPYGPLPTPSPQNDYKFTGWFTATTGGTQIKADTVFTGLEDILLHARWVEKKSVGLNENNIVYETNYTIYNKKPIAPFAFTFPSGYTGPTDGFKIQYKLQSATAEWTEDLPVKAGAYDVKITRELDEEYKQLPEITLSNAEKPPVHIDKMTVYPKSNGYAQAGNNVRIYPPSDVEEDCQIRYVITLNLGWNVSQQRYIYKDITSDTGMFTKVADSYEDKFTYRIEVVEDENYHGAKTDTSAPVSVWNGVAGNYTMRIKSSRWLTGGAYTAFRGRFFYYANDEVEHTEESYDSSDFIKENMSPWEFSGYGLRYYAMGGSPGNVNTLSLDVVNQTDNNVRYTHTVEPVVLGDLGLRIEMFYIDDGSGSYARDTKDDPDLRAGLWRNVLSVGDFETAGSGSIDLTKPTTNVYKYYWDGKIKDQWYTDGYDCFAYPCPPMFTVTASNREYDRFIKQTSMAGFEIDTTALKEYMLENGGADFYYTVTLQFDENTANPSSRQYTKYIDVKAPENSNSFPQQTAGAESAEADAVLTLGTVESHKGDTVEVPVSLTAGLWGILASVDYPHNALELVSCSLNTDGEFAPADTSVTLTDDMGASPVKILVTHKAFADIDADGGVMTLTFKVKDDAVNQSCVINAEVIQAVSVVGESGDGVEISAVAVDGGVVITTATHVHSWGTEWVHDGINHWHECTDPDCDVKGSLSGHIAGEWIVDIPATETEDGSKHKECTVCGETTDTDIIPKTGDGHTHTWSTDWKNDGTNHWKECSCGAKNGMAAHSLGDWIIEIEPTHSADGRRHKECSVCAYETKSDTVPKIEHTWGTSWESDGTNHWHACSGCAEKKDTAAHTFGDWRSDSINHWKLCSVCSTVGSLSGHSAGEWIVDKEATETEDGSKHKECTVCAITTVTEAIPATHTHSWGADWRHDTVNHWKECSGCEDKGSLSGHEYGEWIIDVPPTINTSGTRHRVCGVCEYESEPDTVPPTGVIVDCECCHPFYAGKAGHILGEQEVTIFDALEVLKALVDMDGALKTCSNASIAALITDTSKESGNASIFDALEILKFLVNMDNDVYVGTEDDS